MTYHVSIVDDEVNYSLQLKEYVEKYSASSGQNFDVKIFEAPDDFLERYPSETDILFVDIKMPGMTGIDLVERLRKLDNDLIVMFTTSFRQYAISGYSVRAFDFLLKPIEYSVFENTMNRAMTLLKNKVGKCINIRNAGEFIKLPIRKITFIEVLGRKLTINLIDGTSVETQGSLSEVEKDLQPFGFVRCAHSFLVNLDHVTVVKNNDIFIADKQIPISRGTKKEFMMVLAEYLNKN